MDFRHWSLVIGSLIILILGIQLGRQVERIQQLRVDQVLVEKVVISKPAAWNRVYGKRAAGSKQLAEDLRLPRRTP